MFVDRYMS
uniref:Uncharacterized protein n=1 Tax=Arundo donax TaxID=35708 RepID=A0A0A9H3S5_ARUDO